MRSSATIELIGYVGSKPEHPHPERFPSLVSFSLPITRKWQAREGGEQSEVTWYKCQSWSEGLSTVIRQHVREGMGLIVRGVPKARAYLDKQGLPKVQIDVQIQDLNMLTFPKQTALNASSDHFGSNGKFKIDSSHQTSAEVLELPSDDIPF